MGDRLGTPGVVLKLFIYFFFRKICILQSFAYCANAKWRLRLRLQLFNCVFTIMSISRQPNFQLCIKIYIYSKVIITNTFSIARFCITQIAFKPNRLEAFRRRESRLSIALVPSFVLFIMQQFRTIERTPCTRRYVIAPELFEFELLFTKRRNALTCESHEISYRKNA